MANIKTFLFVSIDGMTDPLGQSQVIPYLIGLSKKGFNIGIVSCEKKENWNQYHTIIENTLKSNGINWQYSFYKNGVPFISQIQNYLSLKTIVIQNIKKKNSDIVLHCRSYLAGLIGLYSKKTFNTGFIFDMRGFWADERIEGGIWNGSSLIGRSLFSYFKKKEKEMLANADAIVTLTDKAKTTVLNWNIKINPQIIKVIPCCVDLDHFSTNKVDSQFLIQLKNKYPQLENKFVLSYVGSLGTWYMADEMLAFFKLLSENTPSVFLIITKDEESLVYEAAKKHSIPFEKLIIVTASRAEMPSYISLSSASVFFIKPSFSKTASSPTKMGEILSMGVPVITNSGIGDVDDIIHKTGCGILISDFNQKNYETAIATLLEKRNLNAENIMHTAGTYFSLEKGINKYEEVYHSFN